MMSLGLQMFSEHSEPDRHPLSGLGGRKGLSLDDIHKNDAFEIRGYESPIGKIIVAVDSKARLFSLDFSDSAEMTDDVQPIRQRLERDYKGCSIRFSKASSNIGWLNSYFSGDITALQAVEFVLNGTVFQRKVWQALCKIMPGTTCSYKHIAQDIGSPKACRAVGAANGVNPIAIVVPCHRVIGASGQLVGYAKGLQRKAWLLEHEARHCRI